MPQLVISRALVANAQDFPLSALGWQYEYVPWPCAVKLLLRSTTAAVKATIYSGSETIQEEAPIQGGGTAGTTPSELNTPPVQWVAAAGDRLKINLRETGGAAATVDGVIVVAPMI